MNFEKQPPVPLDSFSQKVLSGSLLHFACYAGDGELVDLLLTSTRTYNNNEAASGSCVNMMLSEEDSINRWTPAHWAAFYGQLNCLMKLHIQPNIGFDTPTEKSHTSPLHLAAQSGAILCLKWLLQCGASINRQDFMGETPLHKAAKAGNTDSAAMLVSHGASLDLKNQRGCTPADLAELADHPTLPLYLRRSKDPQTHADWGKSGFVLPISDLNPSVPYPSSLPPPHLPHPDHFKYSKFPYVNDHYRYVDRSLLQTRDGQDSGIVMNGLPIGNTHSCPDDSDSYISESVSGHSLQSCSDMDTLTSVCRTKRSFGSMGETWPEEEEDSGVGSSHSPKRQCPKRQCFGFRHGTEKCYPDYRDVCNNNIVSSSEAFLPTSDKMASDMFHLKSKNSSPHFTHSSEMEHQEAISAEQGYDSSMMCAMLDDMS